MNFPAAVAPWISRTLPHCALPADPRCHCRGLAGPLQRAGDPGGAGHGHFVRQRRAQHCYFEDAALTHQIANLALVFILFQGGFSTKQVAVRQAALP
jgi:hypothetical protein